MGEEPIREYLTHFTYALIKAGAPSSVLDGFRDHWNAQPPGALRMPCPLCYAADNHGWLTATKTGDGIRARCDLCHEQFLIGR